MIHVSSLLVSTYSVIPCAAISTIFLSPHISEKSSLGLHVDIDHDYQSSLLSLLLYITRALETCYLNVATAHWKKSMNDDGDYSSSPYDGDGDGEKSQMSFSESSTSSMAMSLSHIAMLSFPAWPLRKSPPLPPLRTSLPGPSSRDKLNSDRETRTTAMDALHSLGVVAKKKKTIKVEPRLVT